MRNPQRINYIITKLRIYWLWNPDLRLCQIIGNFAGHDEQGNPRDPYHVEDDVFEKWLDEQISKHAPAHGIRTLGHTADVPPPKKKESK